MTRARDVANLIGSGNYSSTTFTATAGQTAFTISHTQGFIQVFMNGLLLDETVDYTSNGSAVTLTSGAAAGDEIEVVAYNTFSVGDALNQAAADTRYVNTSGDTMTGTLVAGTRLQVGDSSITQQYPTMGYVADFQASTGSQTFISIAAPNASSLGDNGVIIGEDATDTYITQRGNKNIKLATQDVNRLIIDGSGRVTSPNQPSFSVRSNGGNSGNTWTQDNVIKFQTVQHNVGSHYSTSTGRFTAPVNGFYVFHYAGFGYNGGQIAAGNTTGVALRTNGTNFVMFVYDYSNSSNGYPSSTGSVGLYLAASDYAEIYTTSQGQYADASNMYTHWSGYLLH